MIKLSMRKLVDKSRAGTYYGDDVDDLMTASSEAYTVYEADEKVVDTGLLNVDGKPITRRTHKQPIGFIRF